MNMNMNKAILYCRVSSDEQAKGGSLKYQEEALRRYCNSHQIEIVEVFSEDYSAKTFNRPEMNKICKKYLKKKKEIETDTLLVLRWNRFTRDASDGWEYISRFKKYGIEVNAIEEHIDFSIAESKITLSVFLTMAEVDNDKRSKATRDGIHQALSEGKCAGLAPYGYINKRTSKHNCWIEHDPVQAPFVVEAFSRVAYGVEAPTLVWKDLKKQGMRVSESTFFRMLKNRFYIGEVFVPAYGTDEEHYVKGKYTPMVDVKTFNAVQKRLAANEKPEVEVKKTPDEIFYMRSFLKCPYCGSTVYGSFSKGRNKKYPYYHCNYCGQYRISADEANDNMQKYLTSIKPNQAILALYEQIFLDIQKQSSKTNQDSIKRLKQEIVEIDNKMEKVRNKWLEEIITDENFNDMYARLKEQKKEAEMALFESKEQPTSRELEEKIKYALAFVENVGTCLASAPITLKLNILGSIFSGKIVFENEKPRTENLSPLVSLITGNPSTYKGEIKKKPSNDIEGFTRGG